jgi:hypothetical protein
MSNSSISNFLSSKDFNIKIVSTIGDGSCLFHSIASACSPSYQKMTYIEKRKYVRAFRDDLAQRVNNNPKLRNILGKYTEIHDFAVKEMERVKQELEKFGFQNVTLESLEKKETQDKLVEILNKVYFNLESDLKSNQDTSLSSSLMITNNLLKSINQLPNEYSDEAYISSWFVRHLKSDKQVGYEMIECISRLLEINIYVIEESAKMQLPSTNFEKSIVVYHSGIQLGHYETIINFDFGLFSNKDSFIDYVRKFILNKFIGDEKKY